MTDWFTGLVADACAEVVGSDDIQRKLAQTDRVKAESVTTAVAGSAEAVDELREQFSSAIAKVRQLDADKEARVRDLVPDEWLAVVRAESRRSGIEGSSAARERTGAWQRAARLLPAGRFRGRRGPDTIAAAEAAVSAARGAFDAAKVTGRVLQDQEFRALDAGRAAAEADLRGRLVQAPALTRRVNAVIDGALAASYEREFSYLGHASLDDYLGHASLDEQPAGELAGEPVQPGDEVNQEAIKRIQGLIDRGFTGTVGVAGPRGIGKTTLLNRFTRPVHGPSSLRLAYLEHVSDRGKAEVPYWSVRVAAPAQYDARDFLLHLFGQLCVSVLGGARARKLEDETTGTAPGAGGRRVLVAWLARYAAAAALACGGVVIALEAARPAGSARSMTDLLIAGCLAAVAAVTAVMPIGPLLDLVDLEVTALQDFAAWSEGRLVRERIIGMVAWRIRLIRLSVVVGSGVLAGGLSALVAVGQPPDPGYLAAALAVAMTVALVAFWRRNPLAGPLSLVLEDWERAIADWERAAADWERAAVEWYLAAAGWNRAAAYWYRKVKFQQSYTTGWSGTVTLAPSAIPVKAQAGWSGSKAVTQVAMSIPEIVDGFRSFTGELRAPSRFGPPSPNGRKIPVVVGIDEVDKIEDPRTAQAFFNQIKGLFGEAECLFLISISDDAMAAYERRGLPLRDAFDSSLSTVIALSYLTRQEARTLAGRRLVRVTEPAADLLYLLSGGLPRELVRLIRLAVDFQRAYPDGVGPGTGAMPDAAARQDAATGPDEAPELGPVPLDELAAGLIAEQAAAQRRAVLIRGRLLEQCKGRDELLAWASDPALDPVSGRGNGTVTGTPADCFARLLAEGEKLTAGCDGTVPDPEAPGKARPHADGCAARETGAFLFWLATVGQVLAKCATLEDFRDAENPDSERSFARLARARQNFALGPDYVHTAVTGVRTAWNLKPPGSR